MPAEKIEAQDFAVRLLKSHVRKERLSHTYLLTGEQNSGRTDLALAFAAAINCEKDRAFEDCDCTPCRKAAAGNYPDLHVFGRDPKIKTIKIEEVRGVIAAASLKPYEGKYKVFVLLDADRLRQEAANAFLKTLEEPPARTVFILMAETRAGLLDTIQSRSFEVRLKPLSSNAPPENNILSEIQGKRWEDYLEGLSKIEKDELKITLTSLMAHFRERMRSPLLEERESYRYVQAMDYLLDAQAALADNANQKLLLSRLAMGFRKINLQV